MAKEGSFEVKVGLAEMLKGGVIMDVMNADQAKIAEDAGAVAVMALERIPALIREEGGIARASDPQMIKDIQKSPTKLAFASRTGGGQKVTFSNISVTLIKIA